MEIENITMLVTTSMISGLVGVLVSIFYHKREEKRKIKFFALRDLYAYRFELNQANRPNFNKAINQIPIIFTLQRM